MKQNEALLVHWKSFYFFMQRATLLRFFSHVTSVASLVNLTLRDESKQKLRRKEPIHLTRWVVEWIRGGIRKRVKGGSSAGAARYRAITHRRLQRKKNNKKETKTWIQAQLLLPCDTWELRMKWWSSTWDPVITRDQWPVSHYQAFFTLRNEKRMLLDGYKWEKSLSALQQPWSCARLTYWQQKVLTAAPQQCVWKIERVCWICECSWGWNSERQLKLHCASAARYRLSLWILFIGMALVLQKATV